MEQIERQTVEVQFDPDAVMIRHEAARQMVRDLCHGNRRWIMSIPARRDDPDLVICDSLRDIPKLLAAAMSSEYGDFVERVRIWQHATFPDSTAQSVLSHLAEEADELQADQTPEEAADVLLLLLAFADKCGFDLLEVAQAKMAVNEQREWTIKAQGGHTKHSG
jgi:NTP pyrophosphatase (non-canonical NTP hydrolase)